MSEEQPVFRVGVCCYCDNLIDPNTNAKSFEFSQLCQENHPFHLKCAYGETRCKKCCCQSKKCPVHCFALNNRHPHVRLNCGDSYHYECIPRLGEKCPCGAIVNETVKTITQHKDQSLEVLREKAEEIIPGPCFDYLDYERVSIISKNKLQTYKTLENTEFIMILLLRMEEMLKYKGYYREFELKTKSDIRQRILRMMHGDAAKKLIRFFILEYCLKYEIKWEEIKPYYTWNDYLIFFQKSEFPKVPDVFISATFGFNLAAAMDQNSSALYSFLSSPKTNISGNDYSKLGLTFDFLVGYLQQKQLQQLLVQFRTMEDALIGMDTTREKLREAKISLPVQWTISVNKNPPQKVQTKVDENDDNDEFDYFL